MQCLSSHQKAFLEATLNNCIPVALAMLSERKGVGTSQYNFLKRFIYLLF